MLKKITDFMSRLVSMWGKWSLTQKIVLTGIIASIFLATVFLVTFSRSPVKIPLLKTAITDKVLLNKITTKLDLSNVKYEVSADNIIYVESENEARRLKAELVREDIIPKETDPWALFDIERWTLTQFERDVNLRRSLTKQLELHIQALDDIDTAKVNLVVPKKELLSEDQDPTTVSVIVTPKPGSNIAVNRKKIEGIVKLIQFAVQGLKEDNITIVDSITGKVLNDFSDQENLDQLNLAKKIIKEKTVLENSYTKKILSSLKRVFGEDRVEIIKIDIDLDFVDKTVNTEEHFPVTMKKDNPKTPFSETEVVPSITLSEQIQKESFEGTYFNPEGPPGQEGQTPPRYKDLTNLPGKYTTNKIISNQAVNKKVISEKDSPYAIKRVAVGVAIDGTWVKEKNKKGEFVLKNGSIERKYSPVSPEDIKKANELIKAAINYSLSRNDSVVVKNIKFDRTKEFSREDRDYQKMKTRQLLTVIGITLPFILLILLFIGNIIRREMEHRRRLREERLAKEYQAMQEARERSGEEALDSGLLPEDRVRQEMEENALNIAKEKPEEVAMLIRSWILEDS